MQLISGLIHALPINERRVFNRDEAASYVGISSGHFKKLVEDGTLPGPLAAYGRIRRWDKIALDRALDAANGAIGSPIASISAYDAWKNVHG